jgi:hypothetical protein
VTASLAGGTGALLGTTSVTVSGGIATFTNLADDLASSITLKFTGGSLSTSSSVPIVINPAAPAKLVIQTQPSSTATEGQAFVTQPVVYEEDQYGNVESGDNTAVVSAALASGAGPLQGTPTATLSKGVATFANLGDSSPGTIALEFTAGSLPSAISSSIQVAPVTPPNPTPTILGATVVMTPKTKKKKAALSGFLIRYSIPMNPTTVIVKANYQLVATVKGTKVKPVSFNATYNASSNSVMLTVIGKNPFAKGGQLTIVSSPPNGVSSQGGVYLSSSQTDYRISANGKTITP